MKKSIKIFGLAVCTVLLSATCSREEEHKEALFSYSYTDYVGSSTDSYIQIEDSIYYFHYIEGDYSSYRGSVNINCFSFLMSSLNYQNSVSFAINTEIIKPELFFQKGIRKIDFIGIRNAPLMIGGGNKMEFYPTSAVFTWDTVVWENRIFKGKGFLEIKDTIFTNYPDTIYYPPQKIKFEFK